MEIYYLVALFLLCPSLTFAFTRGARRADRIFAALVIPCVVLIALWRKAGTDYLIYTTHYNFIMGPWDQLFDSNSNVWEPGFVFLVGLFSSVGLGYDALMVSGVAVAVSLCYFVASRAITNVSGFFFALFCLCFLFIPFIRQDLAAALAFLSFHFIVRNKFKSFALAAFVAMSIHLSAAFILLVIIVAELWRRDILFKPSTLKAAAALALVLAALACVLVDPARLEVQASVYAAEGFVQGVVDEQTSALRNSLKFVFYLVLAGLFRYFYGAQIRTEPSLALAYVVVIAFSLVSAVLVQVTPVFSRLSLYLFPFVALVYSGMLRKREQRNVLCIGVATALLLVHFVIAFEPLAEWM